MKLEDYNKYYIQGSDHYLMPKEVLEELFNEMVNWKEEAKKEKKHLEEIRDGYKIKLENLLEEGIEVDPEDFYLAEIEGKANDYDKLLNQQKRFIQYLEDEIEQKTPNVKWKHYNEEGFCDYDVENPICIEVQPTCKVLKEILQKCKDIIVDDE